MTSLVWTRRAISDAQAIRQFIAQDSPHMAELVIRRLIAAIDRLSQYPHSGRVVPEIEDVAIREVIHGSYRIVYRLIDEQVHILTIHHAARLLRLDL